MEFDFKDDFRGKLFVKTFVEGAIERAASYLGYIEAASAPTPYFPLIATVKPFYNRSMQMLSALFTLHQARAAGDRWTQSVAHQNHAFCLKHEYHKNIISLEHPAAKVSEKLLEIAKDITEIDRMLMCEASNYSNCGIFGMLGAIALSLGGYATAKGYTIALWVKQAGAIVLVATAIFYAYTWYSHRGDSEKISGLYEKIGQNAEQCRFDLNYYHNNMQLQATDKQQFTCSYQQFNTNYDPGALEQVPNVEYPKQSYEN